MVPPRATASGFDWVRVTREWCIVALSGEAWHVLLEHRDKVLFQFFPQHTFQSAEEALDWGEFWIFRQHRDHQRRTFEAHLARVRSR